MPHPHKLTNASQCLTPISTNETWFCAPLMDTVLSIKNGEVHPAFALKGKQVVQKKDISEIYKNNSDIQVRGRNIAQLIVSLYKSNKSFGFSQFFIHKDNLYFQHDCNTTCETGRFANRKRAVTIFCSQKTFLSTVPCPVS